MALVVAAIFDHRGLMFMVSACGTVVKLVQQLPEATGQPHAIWNFSFDLHLCIEFCASFLDVMDFTH